MKEYAIFQRHGSASPFIIHTFNNIDNAKLKLYDIVSVEESRGRPYFVDNDFYINKYNNIKDSYYLQIIERDVTEWKQYTEENKIEKDNNKIIYLKF